MKRFLLAALIGLASLTSYAQPQSAKSGAQVALDASNGMGMKRLTMLSGERLARVGGPDTTVSDREGAKETLKYNYDKLLALSTSEEQKRAVKEWRLAWEAVLGYSSQVLRAPETEREVARVNAALRLAFE